MEAFINFCVLKEQKMAQVHLNDWLLQNFRQTNNIKNPRSHWLLTFFGLSNVLK